MHYYNISVVTSASFATSERLTGFFLTEWDGKRPHRQKRGLGIETKYPQQTLKNAAKYP